MMLNGAGLKSLALLSTVLCVSAGTTSEFPSHLDAWPLSLGALDVTAAPFYVDNGGTVDVTSALQKAIHYAHDNFLVVYLPHGQYLVSRTLRLYSNNSWDAGLENNTWPNRFQPNAMLGARAKWMAGRPLRPVIRLADHAPGFSGSSPRPVLDFTQSRGRKPIVDGINFNQLLRGVDVHIGNGTPQAAGVQMPGAQGCAIQDVTVSVGSGYAGIIGGSGAGGSHTNVRIEGGRVGLDYTVSLNAPATNGATLVGQTQAAIVYVGIQAASFVGAYIAPASRHVPALRSVEADTLYGQVSLVDTVIEYPDGKGDCMAFDTSHSLYLRHVHVYHCSIIRDCDGRPAVVDGGPWTTVHELAKGVPIVGSQQCAAPLFKSGAPMPIYFNGMRSSGRAPCAWLSDMSATATGPTTDFTAKHTWNEQAFPTFDIGLGDGSIAYDVRTAPYGAVGDGAHDDTDAIQRAIDDAAAAAAKSSVATAVVFLPKGFYRLSRTLNLTAPHGTTLALLGIARHLSVIMPMSHGLLGMARNPAPMLHVGASDGTVHLSMFTMVTWEHLGNVWALEWQSRNVSSIYRQNYFYRITECLYGFPHPLPRPVPHPTMPCKPAAVLEHPLNVINGSGHFFNFENEDFLYESKQYRHMLITHPGVEAGGQEVHLYSMNFEHASSDANAAIINASNVHIYSLKTEGEWRDIIYHGGTHNPAVGLYIANSSNVNVYSHGGNARARPSNVSVPARSLYQLENSCPIRLTNLVDQFQFPPDDDWNMVEEAYHGAALRTSHCDRPVLFARTDCRSPSSRTPDVFFV